MRGKGLFLALGTISFALAQEVEPVEAKTEVHQARALEELVKVIEEADEILYAGEFTWSRERLFRREFLKSWIKEELDLYAEGSPGKVFTDWMFPMGEQSAFYDHRNQVEFFKNFDAELKKIQEEAGRGLESNSAENIARFYWKSAEATLAGWSRRDPRAAWKAVRHPDGEFHGQSILNDYGYLAPRSIFENLVKIDPELVWREFTGETDVLFRESMLIGIGHGLPVRSDWRGVFEQVLESGNPPAPEYRWVLRGLMMGRWLEADASAAEEWFRSEEGKAISLQERTLFVEPGLFHFLTGGRFSEGLLYKTPASLAPAVVYWMERDLDGGLAWLKNRPETINDLFFGGGLRLSELLGPKDWRKILKNCLSKEKREEFLEALISADDIFSPDRTRDFFGYQTERALSDAIDELEVNDELGDRIFSKLR